MTENPEPRYRITVERTGAGRYLARNRAGAELAFGGEDAFSPVELLLTALVGCSAVDVDTLTSRRAEPEAFLGTVTAERERDEKGASYVDDIRVVFSLAFEEGEAGDAARAVLPDAVRLSHDRLCTVANTLRRGAETDMSLADGGSL